MQTHSTPGFDYTDITSRALSPEELIETLRVSGYFYLTNLGDVISPQLFRSMKETSANFFASPLDAKMSYYIGDSNNHRGYVPTSEKGLYGDEKARFYEAFDIGHDAPSTETGLPIYRLIGPNRYPEHVPGMKQTLESYYRASLQIGTQILRMVARASRLNESYFDRYTTRPASQLRIIHYLQNDVLVNDDVSMGAHTDYEIFTVLHQTSPGLMAFDRATRSWKQLPVFKDTLLVFAGNMMELMTGGHVKSLLHRVVSTGEERYSYPFFMNLDFETTLGVLPAFGTSDKRVVVGHHLLGQLYRDFPYIKDRIDGGRWNVDFTIPGHNEYDEIQ